MASNTSPGSRSRARAANSPATVFTCPACDGQLRRVGGSVRCEDCGHVPRHGAD